MQYVIETQNNKLTLTVLKPIIQQDGTLILVATNNTVLAAFPPGVWKAIYQAKEFLNLQNN